MGANRVEGAIEKWRAKEQRISNIFSFSLSTNTMLKRDKLLYYDMIANKYAGTKIREERFSLKMLREERRSLERQLYPNRLLRLLRRLIIATIWVRIGVRREERKAKEQIRSLQGQVRKAGFEIDDKDFRSKIDQGLKKFKLPIEIEINNNEVQKHQLRFKKDSNGKYQFEGFYAILSDRREPSQIRERFFDANDRWELNNREAYQLLSGKSLKKGGKFLKLDFNDKTASGDFRLKESDSNRVSSKVKLAKPEQVTGVNSVKTSQKVTKRNGTRMKLR